MAFFAIVIALLLEQVRPLGQGNAAVAALRRWVRGAGRAVDAGGHHHAWLAWALAVLMPALAALGVYLFLHWLGGWPLALAWNVAVLYVTLGFRQFSYHFTGIRDALDAGDEERARQLLARWQQVDASALPRSEIVRHVIEYSVLAAHRHVFGVLTWYCLLAALGLHTRQAAPAAAKQPAPLSDTERRVLAGIGPKPVGIEELCVSTGLPMSALLGTLMKLELTGRVYKQPGQRYVLR